MSRPRKYTDVQMVEALTQTRGMVYLAAGRIGCNPETIYERAKVSQAVADTLKIERGKVIDLAESKLFEAIDRGEPWAVRMALMTLGKSRGYVERVADNAPDADAPPAVIEVESNGR